LADGDTGYQKLENSSAERYTALRPAAAAWGIGSYPVHRIEQAYLI